MTASTLQKTGKCHWCGEPTKNLFCPGSCGDKYRVYQRRGKSIPANAHRTDDKAVFRFTAMRISQEQIDRNIERIAQRAAENGTLGWATLAPQQ